MVSWSFFFYDRQYPRATITTGMAFTWLASAFWDLIHPRLQAPAALRCPCSMNAVYSLWYNTHKIYKPEDCRSSSRTPGG